MIRRYNIMSSHKTLAITDVNSSEILNSLLKPQKEPFITVKFLSKEWPAFLDCGSSISILGDQVIKYLKSKNIRCHIKPRVINSLQGSMNVAEFVTLKIDYLAGVKLQKFTLAPGTISTILLGRDFLGPTKIGVFVGLGGWTVGTESQQIIPFVNYPYPFLLKQSVSSLIVEEEPNLPPSFIEELSDDEGTKINNLKSEETKSEVKKEVKQVPLFPSSHPNVLLVPETLSTKLRKQIADMMQEFLPMFTKKPGHCKLYKHTIDTGNCKPIRARLRPMSPGKRKIFDDTFDELLEYGVIEPSSSPWASTGFIVPKPDGLGVRCVINYKPLNKYTIPDRYPINRMDDMLAFLGESTVFSLYDLTKGFHQIEVAEEDRPKTAFISHRGLWQFKMLPMGLINSPSTFQRTLDAVLGDLKWKCCLVYFDDIIVFSKSVEQHIMDNKAVLDKLRIGNLTINPQKVKLWQTRLRYLGHVIEPGRCYPDPEKVKCIKKYPVPKNVKEVQQFLGLIGFYRKFIPNVAIHAKPLTKFLKSDIKFCWSPEAQNSFDYLRTVLTELSELHLPNLNGQFIISCDASRVALGAILQQVKDKVRFPIWFASRCLKSAETRYSVSELECLCVIWAIEKFRGYIEYTKFIVETDHQALSWLQNIKDPVGRLAHWFLILQEYEFEVHYKPGNSLNIRGADALSRLPEILLLFAEWQNESSDIIDESKFNSDISINLKIHGAEKIEQIPEVLLFVSEVDSCRTTLIEAQDQDAELSVLKKYLLNQPVPMSAIKLQKIKNQALRAHILEDGMLMHYVGPKGKPWEEEESFWRIWIPSSFRLQILSIFHEDLIAGHLGIRKTYLRLEQRIYWFGMRRDVNKYVKSCVKCQECKNYTLPTAPASSFQPESPWEIIATDLMGPYPKGTKQSCYLLVVVDMFTKFVELYPLKKATAEKVIEKLWLWVCCRWGLPRLIVTDNGPQFGSKVYSQWCNMLGIQTFHIAVYHAQANITERYNKTVKEMIVTSINKCKDWDKHLHEIAFALRTAVNDSTKFTPAYLNTGREFRTPFDNLVNIDISSVKLVKNLGSRLTLIQSIARDNILHSQEKYLSYYNHNTKLRSFNVNDYIWYKTHYLSDASKGFNSKLAPKRELCQIVEQISKTVYDIERVVDGQRINKVHVNDLMSFIPDESESIQSTPSRAILGSQ